MSVTAGSVCIPVIECTQQTLVLKLDVCSNELDCKFLPLHARRCVLPEDNGRVEHHFQEPSSSSVTQLIISLMCPRLHAGDAGLQSALSVLLWL
jgi:hypothetical protein